MLFIVVMLTVNEAIKQQKGSKRSKKGAKSKLKFREKNDLKKSI